MLEAYVVSQRLSLPCRAVAVAATGRKHDTASRTHATQPTLYGHPCGWDPILRRTFAIVTVRRMPLVFR